MRAEQPLAQMTHAARVIIVLGSGGVGKTTSAIALATLAAQQGKKVGLLSIDPAKRLADAMGMRLSHKLEKVSFSAAEGVKGELWATMLDQKAVFDEMVRRFAPSPKIEQLILKNGVYKAASNKLGGPLEYMALAKLQQMAEDSSFDLIVLDTPPDTHALDFLVRPNVLEGFMENKVMRLLVKPFALANKLGRGKLISFSEKLMGGLASVTGITMLRKLAEFLVLMEDIIQGFHHAGSRVAKLLRLETTQFLLVSAPTGASCRSAEEIAIRLKKEGFPLRTVLMNRVLPSELQNAVQVWERQDIDAGPFQEEMTSLRNAVRWGGEFSERLRRHAAHLFPNLSFVTIEEQSEMIHSRAAILRLASLYANSQ